MEFKVFLFQFPIHPVTVDIETEWNLKKDTLSTQKYCIIVDIETEWNLKQTIPRAMCFRSC